MSHANYQLTHKRYNAQVGTYEEIHTQSISFAEAQLIEDYFLAAMNQPKNSYMYVLSDGQNSRSLFSLHCDILAFIKANKP